MYHVVASDLDGTLLSPDHTLSPYAKETLKLLTQRGVHFVFATGRHHIDVAQIRDSPGDQRLYDHLQRRAGAQHRRRVDLQP